MHKKLRQCELEAILLLLGAKYWSSIQIERRKVDIFFSDGYETEEYRSWFFCVKGSYNKLCGFVRKAHIPENEAWYFETSQGNYYCTHNKVQKRAFWVPSPNRSLDPMGLNPL